MRIAAIATAVALLATAPAVAGLFGDDHCRHSADRRVSAPAAGITKVVIQAEAGSLKVDGVRGATAVVAAGRACTSEGDMLDGMVLKSWRSGSVLHVQSVIPRKTFVFGFSSATLGFAVTLPEGMPVDIEDDSGWMKVANTGETSIDDDSGAIEARSIHGSLTIDDDSGAIEVEDIGGNVRIEDDSGEIVVQRVRGDVRIEDDSGSIEVAEVQGSLYIPSDDSGSIGARKVRGNVRIDRDSSGSVDASDIGGDFIVRHKSSGHIDYDRVAGKVDIPRRWRD